jgi:hypothetical protein
MEEVLAKNKNKNEKWVQDCSPFRMSQLLQEREGRIEKRGGEALGRMLDRHDLEKCAQNLRIINRPTDQCMIPFFSPSPISRYLPSPFILFSLSRSFVFLCSSLMGGKKTFSNPCSSSNA